MNIDKDFGNQTFCFIKINLADYHSSLTRDPSYIFVYLNTIGAPPNTAY